ncbi:hypothetical protein GGU11DRAFT_812117 [Lentinula aff. detonsa]|nr:hypothetical protein GGU11DRAFT_812117 [Lentinula aff. detonsa]
MTQKSDFDLLRGKKQPGMGSWIHQHMESDQSAHRPATSGPNLTPIPPLSGFISMGSGIYLRQESSASFVTNNSPTSNRNAPNIILVFGWMGAKLPHISKYTKVYEETYPNATQIIVQSNPLLFWSSNRTRMKNLLPVAEILEASGCVGTASEIRENNSTKILVHCFSNGGGVQMLALGNLLHARLGSSSSLAVTMPQVSAVVFDSCPGTPSLWRTVQAFNASLHPVIRIPVVILITFFYSIVTIIKQWLFGIQPISERLKEGLLRNGPEGGILPWITEKTPRMYVCSKKDDLIPIDQVEEHVQEAIRRGLNARIEVYENTPHVAHARRYPERYWGAVKALWASAVEKE